MNPIKLRIPLLQLAVLVASLAPVRTAPAASGSEVLTASSTCQEALVHLPVSWNHPRPNDSLAKGQPRLTADQLNKFGFRCHRESRFEASAHFFKLAIHEDPKHTLAHYNLACALSRLREQEGHGCGDPDAMIETIKHHLRTSIALDKQRAIRARTDRDLDVLRTLLDFRLLYTAAPQSASDLAALFHGVTLWGPTPGVFTLAEATFTRTHSNALSGTVKGWTLDVEGGTMDRIPRQGTWRAKPGTIIVDWAGPPGSTEVITLDKLNSYATDSWNTSPSECEA